MRRRSRPQEDSAVDLTPMLDIVFIMLIFFIVTATFVREDGIDVQRPPPDNEANQSNDASVVIFLSSQGQVQFGDRYVETGAVRSNAERFMAENPKGSILVQAGTKSKVSLLVDVINQLKQAGAPHAVVPSSE